MLFVDKFFVSRILLIFIINLYLNSNDYFTIERSEDGINFYTIGITDGAGNSNNALEYQYVDNEPLNGTNLYRIRQTDFDGQYSYSAIVSIYFQNIRDNIIVHSENGFLIINLTSENESDATLSIFDMNGKQVTSENYIINKGQNLLSLNNEIFSKSIYLIHLMKSDGISISRKYFLH